MNFIHFDTSSRNQDIWLPSKRFVVTPAVHPRLFENSDQVDIRSTAQKSHYVNSFWKGILRGKKDITSMAVPQNKKISVIDDKLLRREFISITVLISFKKSPASNYGYYGFHQSSQKKNLSVTIVGKMVASWTDNCFVSRCLNLPGPQRRRMD